MFFRYGFQKICRISCEICRISWNQADFMWNPPATLKIRWFRRDSSFSPSLSNSALGGPNKHPLDFIWNFIGFSEILLDVMKSTRFCVIIVDLLQISLWISLYKIHLIPYEWPRESEGSHFNHLFLLISGGFQVKSIKCANEIHNEMHNEICSDYTKSAGFHEIRWISYEILLVSVKFCWMSWKPPDFV